MIVVDAVAVAGGIADSKCIKGILLGSSFRSLAFLALSLSVFSFLGLYIACGAISLYAFYIQCALLHRRVPLLPLSGVNRPATAADEGATARVLLTGAVGD